MEFVVNFPKLPFYISAVIIEVILEDVDFFWSGNQLPLHICNGSTIYLKQALFYLAFFVIPSRFSSDGEITIFCEAAKLFAQEKLWWGFRCL